MLYSIYLKNGIVYLPTTVNQGIARYMEVEPVTVVPVADTDALRRALRATIPKQNDFVAPSIEDARKPAVVLKYTGDKAGRHLCAGHRHGRYRKRTANSGLTGIASITRDIGSQTLIR
jgi:hypothetical protein